MLACVARVSLLAALVIFAAACPPVPPTLAQLTTQIFEPRCSASGCHGVTDPARALNLQTDAHAGLVDVASVEDPAMPRVAPGEPDGSLLYLVLVGPVGATRQMPPGATLPAEDVESVRRWIEAGAAAD